MEDYIRCPSAREFFEHLFSSGTFLGWRDGGAELDPDLGVLGDLHNL